jgi:uncharacterized Zn-binding protein involved in type VI secretion
MKKFIAALFAVPVALAATVGDDIMKIVAKNGDNFTTGVPGIARQGDNFTTGVPGIARSGDNVVQVGPASGVLNPQQAAETAVSNDLLRAISSGVNKNSTEELMEIARQANREQSRQTGVLLSDAALLTIVYQAGAGTAAPREQ